MRQKIVEVLAYLLNTTNLQPAETVQGLADAGFSKEVVVNTFDWIQELIEQQCWYAVSEDDGLTKTNKTFRIFDAEESSRINLEARNFILFLEYSGVLDTKIREIVINQLMQLNQRMIGLVDAKWVVLLVLMSKLNRNIQEMRSYFLATMTQEG